MKNLINELVTIVIYLSLLFSTGKGFVLLHETVKRETLTQISKGLSSSENLAKALSGE